MRRALDLARRGLGQTSPNPCVGAVIVRGQHLLGEGWHQAAGQPHAEVEAVRDAHRRGHDLKGSTLYVTLEPCSTHGRTPPCTDLIVREKFKRVVVGATDPNPAHAGRAFPLLRAAGITVTEGILAEECTDLNRAFNHWIVTKLPWVILKLAVTADGALALPKGQGRWLTGPLARQQVHELRARCDAILVGAETVRQDRPRLTVRGIRGARQPHRIVLSRSRNLPMDAPLFTDRWKDRTRIIRPRTIPDLLKQLGKEGMTSLLVEGGAEVADQFIRSGCVQELVLFIAPKWAGNHSLPRLKRWADLALTQTKLEMVGPDLRLDARVVSS